MLPARFEPYLFGLILSGVMSLIVTGISTLRALGPSGEFSGAWMQAWMLSWPTAFLVVLVAAPLVRRLVRRLVAPADAG